jgi:hypothetical protein
MPDINNLREQGTLEEDLLHLIADEKQREDWTRNQV